MIRLTCSGITFWSQLDEKHLFFWAREIPCVVGWDQDTLLIRSRRISEPNLRDLIARFETGEVPVVQQEQRQRRQQHAPAPQQGRGGPQRGQPVAAQRQRVARFASQGSAALRNENDDDWQEF